MKNRYQVMDDFIKWLACVLEENEEKKIPDEELNNLIYSYLIKINDKDKEADLSSDGNGTFTRLNSYFKDCRNIETFVDPKDNYYMQLQNRPEEHLNGMETIKLYIPQDSINMERSARELFDFLNSSNISHISKISKNERSDDIVVQVTNWNDANTIINFARGNRQLKNGMLDANPFLFSVDNISVSTSRGGSINKVISSLLTTYFNDKIINDKLGEANLLDFTEFAQKYHKHHFVDFNDIGEVVTDFNLKGCEYNTSENNKKIANVGTLVDLFVKGLNPKFDLESCREFYLENSNEGKFLGDANAISLLRNYKNNVNGSNFVGSIDSILLESVDTFKEKYHIDDAQALKIVQNYLMDSNCQKITRENGIRDKYIKGDFANKMNRLLVLSGMDLSQYYRNKKDSRAIRSVQDAIFETYVKYEDRYEQGFEQVDGYSRATYALKRLISHSDALAFTRDNNARNNLLKYGNTAAITENISKVTGVFIDPLDDKSLTDACSAYVTGVINEKLADKDYGFVMQ